MIVPFPPNGARRRGSGGGPRSWDLLHLDRPMPMNAYRRLSPFERARYDREWRAAFAILARAARIPLLPAVIVTVAQTCRHHSLPDVGASYPTAKAAIDGLVDGGVIADDTPEHVRALVFVAPERSDRDRFVLIVEEHTEVAP